MKYEAAHVLPPLASAATVFARQRAFAEHCFTQLSDEQFFHQLVDADGRPMNSVAQLAQHVGGNLKSRFTDFLTEDGEKPWRNREAEFDVAGVRREQINLRWNEGWQAVESALSNLTDEEMGVTVTIRQVPHTVAMAITRSLDHIGYHAGQIALQSRMMVGGERWQWFTLAPGTTAAFNEELAGKHGK